MLWSLLACTGTFHTEEGPDEVRSALWFDVTTLEGIEDPAVPRQSLLLLLNSTLPCRAPEVENDPDTPDVDEAAAAVRYWQAQLYTAFSREGALAVAMGLYTYEPEWTGEYSFYANTFAHATDRLREESRVAYGAWYRVDEAALIEADGVYYVYEPTRVTPGVGVEDPAWVRVTTRGDAHLAGQFSFTPTELSGTFRAEACDNGELLDAVIAQIVSLQYLEATVVEG